MVKMESKNAPRLKNMLEELRMVIITSNPSKQTKSSFEK